MNPIDNGLQASNSQDGSASNSQITPASTVPQTTTVVPGKELVYSKNDVEEILVEAVRIAVEIIRAKKALGGDGNIKTYGTSTTGYGQLRSAEPRPYNTFYQKPQYNRPAYQSQYGGGGNGYTN